MYSISGPAQSLESIAHDEGRETGISNQKICKLKFWN